MTDNFDAYQGKLEEISTKVVSALQLEERFGVEDPEKLHEKLFSIPSETARNIFTGIVNSVMSVVSNGMLVLIFMIFMLSGKRVSNVPSGGIRGEVENSIKRYSITLVLTSGVTGLLVGLTFTILGVDFAWMFGFMAFLLNFIPSIGSIIATILPIPVIILSEGLSMPARIFAIVIPTLIQFGIGNLLQPRLMGKSLNLHPVTVLLSLMFFGVIWGVVGMLMATPITAVLRMLFEKFEYTRQFAMIMAGDLESISK
jgi:AI-2 transport protein TqsA